MIIASEKWISQARAEVRVQLLRESATSATTYTGVPMRRFDELPRMDADTKAHILGVAAAGAVAGKRVERIWV